MGVRTTNGTTACISVTHHSHETVDFRVRGTGVDSASSNFLHRRDQLCAAAYRCNQLHKQLPEVCNFHAGVAFVEPRHSATTFDCSLLPDVVPLIAAAPWHGRPVFPVVVAFPLLCYGQRRREHDVGDSAVVGEPVTIPG